MSKIPISKETGKKLLIWTWCRSPANRAENRSNNRLKFSIVADDCTVIRFRNSNMLLIDFIDPFTGKKVSVNRRETNIVFLNDDHAKGYGIFGFDGFVDRPKRPKPKPKAAAVAIQQPPPVARLSADWSMTSNQNDGLYEIRRKVTDNTSSMLNITYSYTPPIPVFTDTAKYYCEQKPADKIAQLIDPTALALKDS